MEKNYIRQPAVILAGALLILYLLSFVNYEYTIAGFTFRNIDFFMDVKSDPAEEEFSSNSRVAIEPQALFAGFDFLKPLEFFTAEKDNANYAYQGQKTGFYGNTEQLKYFFDALSNAKTKPFRIAHYGDSVIEGDLITADIRELLQKKFGGDAVGWLGIVSQDVAFRTTTKHTFSDNWETASVYTSNPKSLKLGISGEVFIPQGNAWVEYEVSRLRRSLKGFSKVRIFYSDAKSSDIYYSFDNSSKKSARLNPGNGIQELVLDAGKTVKSVRIEFPQKEQAHFYGVSLEGAPGIYVDNFPLRGNSGVDIAQIDPSTLKEFSKYLNYKLIILEFGLNILGSRMTDYSWYEREMGKVIKNLKDAFPETSIVMISVHDKARKRGSKFETDPAVFKLLDAQKKIAQDNGVALWSLFDAMGGKNSMHNWVTANPPLASRDYIHFNNQGAERIAELFVESLLDEYNKRK
jgi:lysophospholipase L1-like esterase